MKPRAQGLYVKPAGYACNLRDQCIFYEHCYMDDITRRYMHDVRIMPSMGKAETAANDWISNRPSVVQRFYRV